MRSIVLLALPALLVAAPAAAAQSERLADKDVKELFERVNNDRDRFEDQLDGKLKREVLRTPRGEVDVERFLDDLQDNIGRMKDRFSSDYSASTEVTTVLQQASAIHRFMSTQPPDFKGASEWNRLAASLGEVAAAYSTRLPLTEGATARRMNDREIQQAAEEVAKAADDIKREVDSALRANKAIDQATRESALKEVDELKSAARTLASRVGDGQPASGEAKALLSRIAALQASFSARPLPPTAQAPWSSVRSAAAKIAQGFSLPAPTSS
jgi:methyl-accepting chemotaxis protein